MGGRLHVVRLAIEILLQGKIEDGTAKEVQAAREVAVAVGQGAGTYEHEADDRAAVAAETCATDVASGPRLGYAGQKESIHLCAAYTARPQAEISRPLARPAGQEARAMK